MRKLLSFTVGAMIGGMVGATLALLLAPATGDQLRGELRGVANRAVDEIQKAAADRRVEMEKQLADLRAPRI